MGIKCVYCIQNEKGISQILHDLYSFECIKVKLLKQKIANNSGVKVIIFLEGSIDFVSSQYKQIKAELTEVDDEESVIICLLLNQRNRKFNLVKQMFWFKISHHQDTGGASTGHFQTAISSKRYWNEAQKEIHKWTMNDFLKSTIRGHPVNAPKKPTLLLDIRRVGELHDTPSVFSNTGWVNRHLSCSEVLRCLDVPQQHDRRIIQSYGTSFSSTSWKYILRAIPGKILLHVLRSIVFFNREKNEMHPDAIVGESDRIDYHGIIHGNFVLGSDGCIEDRNIKSVKSDKAEVPVELWVFAKLGGQSFVFFPDFREIAHFEVPFSRRRFTLS